MSARTAGRRCTSATKLASNGEPFSGIAPRPVLLLGSALPRARWMAADREHRCRGNRCDRASAGISVAMCLVTLELAPAVTVVVYEVLGYRPSGRMRTVRSLTL